MPRTPPHPRAPFSLLIPQASVSFSLAVAEHGLEPILGAAYLMMDLAYVRLDGDRTATLEVALTSKSAATRERLEALARRFLDELETQKVRWTLAKSNQGLRRRIVEQAMRLDDEAAPEHA